MDKDLFLKLAAIAVLIGLIIGMAAGCSKFSSELKNMVTQESIDTNNSVLFDNRYFVHVGNIGSYRFVYDKYTKVMYVRGGHSMTVLFNSDGSPMTYDDWNNLESETTENATASDSKEKYWWNLDGMLF